MTEMKTFKVQCAECERWFHVRYALADPDKRGSGQVHVSCLHCEKNVMVTLPRRYIATEHLVRGIGSASAPGETP